MYFLHTEYGSRPGMTLLISVLVLGAITIVVGAGIAVRGIEEVDVGRSTVQTAEALAAADGCVEETLLQLKRQRSFTGTVLPIGDGYCRVNVSGSTINFAITASGTVLQWTRKVRTYVTISGAIIQEIEWLNPWQSSSSLDSCNDELYECTPYYECADYLGGVGDSCNINTCCGLTTNTCKVDFTGCPAAGIECRSGYCYNSGGNPIGGKTCVCVKSSYSSSSSTPPASSSAAPPASSSTPPVSSSSTPPASSSTPPVSSSSTPPTSSSTPPVSSSSTPPTSSSAAPPASSSAPPVSSSSTPPVSSSASSIDSCNDELYECTNNADCSAYAGGSGDLCDFTICCGITVDTCKYGYSGCGPSAVECRDGSCYNNGGNPTGDFCTCDGL